MIRTLRVIWLSTAFAIATPASAADPLTTGISQFRGAYEQWDQAGFWNATRSFQKAVNASPKSTTARYWLGVAHFHRMLSLRSKSTPRMRHIAIHEMRSAINALDAATKLTPDHAEAHAILATLRGMQIGDSMIDAVRYGPAIHRHHKQALKHGSNNPRVQYLHGAALLHTATDHTDHRKALNALMLADRLYKAEKQKARAADQPRWGHDACLTFLGEAYASLKQTTHAARAYRAALKLRPGNRSAQTGLLTLKQP